MSFQATRREEILALLREQREKRIAISMIPFYYGCISRFVHTYNMGSIQRTIVQCMRVHGVLQTWYQSCIAKAPQFALAKHAEKLTFFNKFPKQRGSCRLRDSESLRPGSRKQ